MSVTPAGTGDVKVTGAFPPLYAGDFPPYYPFIYYSTETVWTFTAVPGPYHTFDKWTGFYGQTSDNPTKPTVNCESNILANFASKMNSVSGLIWMDTDADGVRDAGEAAAVGRVALFDAQGNQVTSWIRPTNPVGQYSISPVAPGEYFLRFLPDIVGYAFSPMHQGPDQARDSDVDPTGRTPGTFTVGLEDPKLPNLVVDAGLVPFAGARTMAQARTLMASEPDLFIVDIRESGVFCQAPGHLVCAENIPWTNLIVAADFQVPPPGVPVLVVGQAVSPLANLLPSLGASALVSLGYSPVYAMKDNMSLWQAAYGPRMTCGEEVLEAEAGENLDAIFNSTVALDAGGSASPALVGIIAWQWAQDSGPAVPLTGAGTPTPVFTAVYADAGPRDLVFSLTVTDACGKTATDQITVHVAVSPGDYNGSGVVDLADAALAARVLTGLPLPENFRPDADPGPNPAVELQDLTYVLSRAAGLR